MVHKIILILLAVSVLSPVSGFSKKNYKNYDRHAANLFLNGLFYEFYSDSDNSIKNLHTAYMLTNSEYVNLALALQLISSGDAESGNGILQNLRNSGFNLGRFGIHLYLELDEDERKARSEEILWRIVSETAEKGDLMTVARILVQIMTDRQYEFVSPADFSDFLTEIRSYEMNRLYRLYFDSVYMLFHSKAFGGEDMIAEVVGNLEDKTGVLPYTFYRIAFEEYMRNKDIEKAGIMLAKMNRITFGEIRYFSDNAGYYTEKGDHAAAENILREGIKEYPASSLRIHLAAAYLAGKNFEKAKIIYDSIISEMPENDYIYRIIASEYHKTDNFTESVRFYERALEVFPEDPQLLNNYAYLLAQNSSSLERALEMADRALYDFPDSISFLDTKAWIFFKMGRYEEAEAVMEEIFSDQSSFYFENSEELFAHYKEIKTVLGKAEELNNISLNTTAGIISDAINRSSYLLSGGY